MPMDYDPPHLRIELLQLTIDAAANGDESAINMLRRVLAKQAEICDVVMLLTFAKVLLHFREDDLKRQTENG